MNSTMQAETATPLSAVTAAPGEMLLRPPQGVEHAPVWLAEAITWAHQRGATDLHLFPSEGEAMLWVRLDGELREVARYPLAVHARMVARLKVLGRCTEYDGELVQEGRFSLNGSSAAGEARLSILPSLRGEKAVIRLLASGARRSTLDELGLAPELLGALRATVDVPQGLLLAVGPSGCGKSTAIYALLADLQERAGHPVSAVTIEDPVEQSLPLATQISVDPARGLDFARGLRAILRQDPEVIMIGEIRDAETSRAALTAALTGHRLLSSMHTLTAAEALVRLRQMGSAPFEVASAVAGVLNLRLARLLCPHCRQPRAITEIERTCFPETGQWPAPELAEAAGCPACLGGGHAGRTGLGEWLTPTAATATALQEQRPTAALAATMKTVVPARPAALALLRDQRMAPGEWRHLAGLTSLAGGFSDHG